MTKTQFSPQPVPPIRKLAQASYPHPSEGRQKKQELQSHGLQDENQSHRSGWRQDRMREGLRFYRMASKSYWGVNICYVSRKGKMTLREIQRSSELHQKDLTQNQKPGAVAQQSHVGSTADPGGLEGSAFSHKRTLQPRV